MRTSDNQRNISYLKNCLAEQHRQYSGHFKLFSNGGGGGVQNRAEARGSKIYFEIIFGPLLDFQNVDKTWKLPYIWSNIIFSHFSEPRVRGSASPAGKCGCPVQCPSPTQAQIMDILLRVSKHDHSYRNTISFDFS